MRKHSISKSDKKSTDSTPITSMFRNLFGDSPIAMFESDMTGRLVWANRKWFELTGEISMVSLGDRWKEMLHPDDRDKLLMIWEKNIRSKVPWEFECRLHSGKNQTTFLRNVYFPFVSHNGKISGGLVMSIDFTPYVQAERKVLNSFKSKAHTQKMEAIGQLAGGIAHDFNNLLTVIMSYSELSIGVLSDIHPVKKHLEIIDKTAGKAAGLTRQLLNFSRNQSHHPVYCDANKLVSDLWGMLRRLISENIELNKQLSEETMIIQMDVNQFEQVLMNLVINARDALPAGGKIDIQTKKIDTQQMNIDLNQNQWEFVVISVRDNGIGMDEKTMEHIFEPFFSTKEYGTGLGLATCDNIIRQNKGYITVHSEPGKGTSFHMYFRISGNETCPKSIRSSIKDIGKTRRTKKTILFVEDDTALLKISSDIIQSYGYTVIGAENGEHAMRMLRDHDIDGIDMVITDIVMPRMGGIELARKLRELKPDIKIILTSGYGRMPVIRQKNVTGEFTLLLKPIRPSDLLKEIKNLLAEDIKK